MLGKEETCPVTFRWLSLKSVSGWMWRDPGQDSCTTQVASVLRQSSAAPKRSVDTPRTGTVRFLEESSFLNKGFRRELVETWKERAPGRPPGAKDGCLPLSKSLPSLVLSFLLCETGYTARWASQSLRGIRFKRPPVPRPRAGSSEAGPAAATPLSAAARHSRPGTDVANLQGASLAGFPAHAASRPSSV